MGYELNTKVQISYEFDLSKDGGAVGAIPLRSLHVNKLREDLVVERATLEIITKFTTEGSATAKIGDGVTADAYFLDIVDVDAGIYSSSDLARGGSLFVTSDATDTTPGLKALKEFLVGDKEVNLNIGTDEIKAGSFKLTFHCHRA